MNTQKFSMPWVKVYEIFSDVAKICTKEMQRSFSQATNQWDKYNLLQKRKELFAELGRAFYETHEETTPSFKTYSPTAEILEIIEELKEVDAELSASTRKEAYDKSQK